MRQSHIIPLDPQALANRFSVQPVDPFEFESLEEMGSAIDDIPEDEGLAALLPIAEFESKIAPLLDRIPDREADLISLYFLHRKRQSEIASIFEVTQAAISYRLDRGIKRIQFLLSIPQVTEEDMRADLGDIFSEDDIDILVLMWLTTCQSEVAKRLELTQGRVRHRFFHAVKVLDKVVQDPETGGKYRPYYDIFKSISSKRFNILREVKLPQWSNRGKDKIS